LIARGVGRSFHGIDISEKAIATARQVAKEQDLPLTYEVADLNFVELPKKSFDLIVAQTCLHHVLFLERVAEQTWGSLKSDGYLWIHDFIGETQQQHDPKRLSIMNQILAVLPDKFRKNKINGRLVTEIKRPEPGHLASPFESIRSSEIVSVFLRWFTIEWKLEFSAFLHLVAPPGLAPRTLKTPTPKRCLRFCCFLIICVLKKKLCNQPAANTSCVRGRLMQFQRRPHAPTSEESSTNILENSNTAPAA
jgi:SAM-dependent methyltransferase